MGLVKNEIWNIWTIRIIRTPCGYATDKNQPGNTVSESDIYLNRPSYMHNM